MTVESNYVIAIASLSEWLIVTRQFFSQLETKPKPIAPRTRYFPRALSKLRVVATNFDWFIALFAPVVIGRSNVQRRKWSPDRKWSRRKTRNGMDFGFLDF